MKSIKNQGKGLLAQTIAEFKKKGEVSIEELRLYLQTKYSLNVSEQALKNRLSTLS